IDGEMSNRLLRDRLRDERRRLGCRPETFYALSHEDIQLQPLNTPGGQKQIEQVMTHLGGVDFVEFDNVMSLIPGDQKEEEGWAKVLPWIKSLTRRSIGQLWVHHTGHKTTHGYGTKTREWQLDTVLHFTEVKRSDADLSFELSFPKKRERRPENREDSGRGRVGLVGDKWTSGAGADFEVRLTNGEADDLEKVKKHVAMFHATTFTRADVDAALGVSDSTAQRRIKEWLAAKTIEVV